MSLVERLTRQLTSARRTSDKLLADFRSPADWLFQACAQTNHALWFAGHMGHMDNFFISLLAAEQAHEPPRFAECFGMGSQPSTSASDYPSIEDVLSYMRQRREVLLKLLIGLRDEDLERPTPAGTPDFLRDVGAVFEMAIWHEGLHSGQLSVVRRALGFPPLS